MRSDHLKPSIDLLREPARGVRRPSGLFLHQMDGDLWVVPECRIQQSAPSSGNESPVFGSTATVVQGTAQSALTFIVHIRCADAERP
jgi:hypothetical protein